MANVSAATIAGGEETLAIVKRPYSQARYEKSSVLMSTTANAEHYDHQPLVNEDGWQHSLWACVLTYGNRGMVTQYRMGTANRGAPTAFEVIASLLNDVTYLDEGEDEFMLNLGYTSILKARNDFAQIQKVKRDLEHMLGDDYEEWVKARENTEV